MKGIYLHLPVLLKMSAEASILILLVLAAQWLFGPRLKPRWRYALWLLVLLRLALPETIPSPASLFNVLKMPAAVPTMRPESIPVETIRTPVDGTQATPTAARPPGRDWLAWLWATGALSLASCALVSQYKFRRRVKRLRPLTDGPTLSLLEDCKALMRVGTPVSLVETEAIKGPTLFGFVRPRLLLPTGLVSSFTPDELRHVFLHELAHIKRHDILTGWMTFGLQVVHWFNPLVWLAFYRLRADRELACDALALSYARAGENESYGLTIVKLLEGFGQPVWGPSLAGILENKQQMKERIRMIAKFHKTDRGLVLAVVLLAALAVVTLTDAQNQTQPQPSKIGEPDASKGVWVVRFEPIGDFSPKTPGEFLSRIHIYSGQDGEIGYFRTTKQGDKLIGSFLAYDGDQLKTALNKVPGIKVISVEKLTQKTLVAYEKSPQESFQLLGDSYISEQTQLAKVGVRWAEFHLWDAYAHGANGVIPNPAKADQWLRAFVKDVYVVRFEAAGNFHPQNAMGYLEDIRKHTSEWRSDDDRIGVAGFLRTKKEGDKLVAAQLSNEPEKLKALIEANSDLKFDSVEAMTPESFVEYEKSPQESLIDIDHPDVSKGVWVVRFEPVGDFAPRTPGEFLARIHIYSGQDGEIGYFRTTKQGDKLIGSFLAYDGDQLKAALDKVPGIKVISVERLTQETLAAYEKSPQESLATDDQLATKVTLTKPYPLSYEGAERDRISVQYAVIELAKQAKLGYDWGASQANAGEVCQKYITPEIEGIPLREALAKIVKPEGLTYDIRDGKIVLQKN